MRRVRWRLTLHEDDAAGAWLDQAKTLTWAELEQSDEPILVVDLPGLDEGAQVRLRWLDADRSLNLELPARRLAWRSWLSRFDLREIRDTLRQSEASVFRAVLHVTAPNLTPIELPVLTV